MSKRKSSELESFCLGLVWKHGPVSVYQLRKLMHESPSSQWRGSAGAIYPLMQLLERAGFLKSDPFAQGKRQSRRYVITQRGMTELKSWVSPPFPPEAQTVNVDPLRVRLHFLGTLTKPGQIAWFSEAMAVLNEVERRIEEWESSNLDIYSRMLAAHGRREVEMRRQWLEEARTRILEVRQERAG